MCFSRFLINRIFSIILLSIMFSLSVYGLDKDAKVAKGKIHKNILCDDDKSQSYALYIPNKYNASKKWPIIFGFSPGGKGEHPVLLSKEGAEKYGYIVVGSNNSKNGPSGPINKAFEAMKKDVLKKYNIDEKRFYAIGFSGGSRVSLRFAFLHADQFKGVIACGAFFNRRTNFEKKDVLLYGIVGDSGFNFPEYIRNKSVLDKSDIPYWVSVFLGKHQWPPKSLVFNGIEFFEYYHQKQNKTLEPKLEKTVFDRALGLLNKSIKKKNWMNVYFGLNLLNRWFAAKEYEVQIAEFKKTVDESTEYNKHIKVELDIMNKLRILSSLNDSPAYWKNLDEVLRMFREKHPRAALLQGSLASIYQYSLRNLQQLKSNPLAKNVLKKQKLFVKIVLKINPNSTKLLATCLKFYAENSDEDNVKKVMVALKKNKYEKFSELKNAKELILFNKKDWFIELFSNSDNN